MKINKLVSVALIFASSLNVAQAEIFGLRMGMSLVELSEKVSLTPVQDTPNLYRANRVPNGGDSYALYYFLVMPEHGLCKISASMHDMQGGNSKIEKELFEPKEKELTALYGAGYRFWGWDLPDNAIAETKWDIGNASPDDPQKIYLQAVGNGKAGGVFVQYEGRNLASCIEWSKVNADIGKWKISLNEWQAGLLQHEHRPNLPTPNIGGSIEDLIRMFAKIDAAASDEFIKKSDTVGIAKTLRDGQQYRFSIEKGINSDSIEKYDAEREVLNIFLKSTQRTFPVKGKGRVGGITGNTLIVSRKNESSIYKGQNNFGVAADIKLLESHGYGIVILNHPTEQLLKFSVQIEPKQARALKEDLAYFVEVELVAANVDQDVLSIKVSGDKPTINNPQEVNIFDEYIPAKIVNIGIYKKSSGEVLAWRHLGD